MILLSVGASAGALEIPGVAREVAGTGRRVEVILDRQTWRFAGPAAFAGSAAVVTGPSETPEAALFAPATAGTLARLARGVQTPVSPARATHVVVAPDLDAATAAHPAVRENLATLREDACRVIEGSGTAMAPAGELVAVLLGELDGPMSGIRLLVTAGGTREPIDSVRFIGNRSSGKMGLALARQASRLGAQVIVVAANIERAEPGLQTRAVQTVEELRAEVLDLAGQADALVMAAAVSDFTPASPVKEKIRRGSQTRSVELAPTEDILEGTRERYPHLFVVAFAATHGDPVADAREKLVSKGADLVVGNDISREGVGFEADENEVHVVGPAGTHFVPRASKEEVARKVLERMVAQMNKGRQT